MKALNHSQIWIALMAAIGSFGIGHKGDWLYMAWVFCLTLFVYNAYRWLKLITGNYNHQRPDHAWSIQHIKWHQLVTVLSFIVSCSMAFWINPIMLINIGLGLLFLFVYICLVFGLKDMPLNTYMNSVFKALILAITWSLVVLPPIDLHQFNMQWPKITYVGLMLFGLAMSFEIRDQTNIKHLLLVISILSLFVACSLQCYFNSKHLVDVLAFYVFAIVLIIRQSKHTQTEHYAWPIDGLIGLYGLLNIWII